MVYEISMSLQLQLCITDKITFKIAKLQQPINTHPLLDIPLKCSEFYKKLDNCHC